MLKSVKFIRFYKSVKSWLKNNNYEIFIQLHSFGGYSSATFKILKINLICTNFHAYEIQYFLSSKNIILNSFEKFYNKTNLIIRDISPNNQI